MAVIDPSNRNQFAPAGVGPDPGYFSRLVRYQDDYDTAANRIAKAYVDQLGLPGSNPPFALTRRAKLNTAIDFNPNDTAGITRGYIRRADPGDITDPTSGYRMNFMFNPSVIQRQYVSYLDQQAVDPFNSLAGSTNLIAAPGILDFSFDLFFDRQIENAENGDHTGTKVDYDYFDLVVRGAVPNLASADTHASPDSGVLLVNPRQISVVFGGDLVVQGRPYNASVRWEKFSSTMVPIRMAISLSMKVLYIGVPDDNVHVGVSSAEKTYESTVAYDTLNLSVEVKSTPGVLVEDPLGLDTSGSGTSSTGSALGRAVGQSIAAGPPGAAMSIADIGRLAKSVGVGGANLITCVAICLAESSGIPNSHNSNPDGTIDVGLWQINDVHGHSIADREDIHKNAQYMFEISHGGTNWGAWSSYNANTHVKFVAKVTTELSQAGLG